jgi:hypothetical protein
VLHLDDAAGELCEAAAEGNYSKLAKLLKLGISPNVADYDKRTPLHLAASEGDEFLALDVGSPSFVLCSCSSPPPCLCARAQVLSVPDHHARNKKGFLLA